MHKDIQHVEAKYWTSVILLGYQVLVEGLEKNYLWLNDTMDITDSDGDGVFTKFKLIH